MGSQEAAPIPFQTVLTNQNAVFLGFLALWGPPVGRASRLKMEFRDRLLEYLLLWARAGVLLEVAGDGSAKGAADGHVAVEGAMRGVPRRFQTEGHHMGPAMQDHPTFAHPLPAGIILGPGGAGFIGQAHRLGDFRLGRL